MEQLLTHLNKYREAGTNDKFKVERWITNEEALVLIDLITTHNIIRYYECGTANGFSACYAALCPTVKSVDTWDPYDRPKLYNEKEFTALKDKIVFHNCKYNDTVKETAVLNNDKALFFIDGDHKMRPARNDINNTMRVIREGSIIVLHDVLGYDWLQGRMNEFLKTHRAEVRATKRGMGIIYF